MIQSRFGTDITIFKAYLERNLGEFRVVVLLRNAEESVMRRQNNCRMRFMTEEGDELLDKILEC